MATFGIERRAGRGGEHGGDAASPSGPEQQSDGDDQWASKAPLGPWSACPTEGAQGTLGYSGLPQGSLGLLNTGLCLAALPLDQPQSTDPIRIRRVRHGTPQGPPG